MSEQIVYFETSLSLGLRSAVLLTRQKTTKNHSWILRVSMEINRWTDLRITDGVTHLGSKGPVLEQQSGHRRKWHTEERHEDVAHSKVDYEVIGDGPHPWRRLYHVANKPVARQSKQEDEAIHYVHCCLIVWGCINTTRSILARYVKGGVIPVGIIKGEV